MSFTFRVPGPSDLKFGGPTPWQAQPGPDLGSLQLQAELAASKQEAAEALGREKAAWEVVARVRADLDEARARQAVYEGAFSWYRQQFRMVTILETMSTDEYDQLVAMQGRLDASEESGLAARKETKKVAKELEDTAVELHEKNIQLLRIDIDIKDLGNQLSEAQAALAEEKAANRTADELLQNAYADTQQKQAELEAARDAVDAANAAKLDLELQIESLKNELDEEEDKTIELDIIKELNEELEERTKELEADYAALQRDVSDKDHLLDVKDARVAHLEEQLQRALASVRVAEATAEAAKSPTAEPHIAPADSLESELIEALRDDGSGSGSGSDSDSGWNKVELNRLVGVIEHATVCIEPVEPKEAETQNLGLSQIQSVIDIAPVEAETQTLGLSQIQSVIDIAPVKAETQTLGLSQIHPVMDITPIEPETKILGLSQIHPVVDITPIEPETKILGLSKTHSAIDITPVEPERQTLGFSTIEAVETTPIDVVAIEVVDSGTQTESVEVETSDRITQTKSVAQTDSITQTESVAKTDSITQTEGVVAEIDSVTQTESVAEIDSITQTERVAQTDSITQTEGVVAETDSVTQTDTVAQTDSITQTESIAAPTVDSITQTDPIEAPTAVEVVPATVVDQETQTELAVRRVSITGISGMVPKNHPFYTFLELLKNHPFFAFIFAIFFLMGLYLFAELQAFLGSTRRIGPYGTNFYLFRLFPVGWYSGSGPVTRFIANHVFDAMMRWETWMEPDKAFLH